MITQDRYAVAGSRVEQPEYPTFADDDTASENVYTYPWSEFGAQLQTLDIAIDTEFSELQKRRAHPTFGRLAEL